MKNILNILLGVFIILAELLFFNKIKIFGVSADILIIFISFIALYNDLRSSYIASFFLGFIKDFACEKVIGLNTFIFTVIIFIIYNIQYKMYKEKFISAIFVSAISTGVYLILYITGSFLFYSSVINIDRFTNVIGQFCAVEILFSIILFIPLKKIIGKIAEL